MTKNTGKPYEELTEIVFARLLEQDNVCAKVERDVVLAGRSTKHQIDVTFEFLAGSVRYRTIVQCKDWGSAVKQEQVLAFHSVLADIPGQPRGVMVSRSGFQAGAKQVAEHHGIQLYELRHPQDEDWAGLVRVVEIEVVMAVPHFTDVRLIPDDAMARAELTRLGMSGVQIRFGGHPSQAPLARADGTACDVNTILNSLVPVGGLGPVRVRHDFPGVVFATVPGAPIKMPVVAVEATITVSETVEVISSRLDHLVAYCFRDVFAGSSRFLSAEGREVQGGGTIHEADES